MAGVELRADFSLVIIFVLVLVSLGGGAFSSWHPDWSGVRTWSVALGASVLFFLSILLHELAHALVGRKRGVPIRAITLFLFGGVAHMDEEPSSPGSELLMALAGPVVSLAVGSFATALGAQLAGESLSAAQGLVAGGGSEAQVREALSAIGPWPTLLLWLGPVNLLLTVFNMIPGFPLDGGRALRAVLWWSTGDLVRATRWASGAGQLVAWALMGLGVLSLLGGGMVQGLWLLLIGWFLSHAARMSYRQVLTREALDDVPVSRLMWTQPARITPDLSLDQLVDEFIMPTDQRAFPVERDGEFLGIVELAGVRSVPRDRWGRTRVDAIMIPAGQLHPLPPEAGADQALVELARGNVPPVPVLEGQHLSGLVRRRDLVRWLALHGGAGPTFRGEGGGL